MVATILERPMIETIFTHLRLDPQPPPKGRAGEPRPTSLAKPHPSSDIHRHKPHSRKPGGVELRAESARRCRHQGQPKG
jgi:hypothetical protein